MQNIRDNGAKSSINFQRCNLKIAPFHNAREAFLPETSHPELVEKNECSCSALAALKKIKKWDAQADEAYQKKYGQKSAVKEQNKVWECVINLRENHTLKDVKKLVKKLEKMTGYRAAQIAVHRDEGRYEEGTGGFIQNIHAHVIFYARDTETGLSLSAKHYGQTLFFEKIQDIVAQELGMTRGKPAEITGAKHMSPRAYKAQKRHEAELEKNNKEWEQKLAEKEKEWEQKKAEWEAKQAEREARREEWERKLPEIMAARRKNEQFLNNKVDWETLKTANRAFMAWHDISTDVLGYPNPNGNLLVEQTKGALASIFRLFGSVSQLAIFLLTRTEAKELKLQNTLNVYKVSENLQRAINLVKNDTTNDHVKIVEKIQNIYNNLPHDKRAELIELAILHAPNSEIREDIKALIEGRFSDIAKSEAAQKRIENRDLRAELKEYAAEAKRIKDELKEMDEENRILNLAERALLREKGAGREQYADQEAENRKRLEELKTLKDEQKALKKIIDDQKQREEKDAETIKKQAAQIKELNEKIAEITEANVKKQKQLEAEKEEARQTAPQTLDIFDIIDEQKPEKIEPEPKIEKPEPIREPEKIEQPKIEPKPEPEQKPEPKKDDFTNIYGYPTPKPEPRRRFDYEPVRKIEPEPKQPEPEPEPFRDPWQEITDEMEKWKKCQSEAEKNLLKNNILQNIEKYEKSGVPPHRQLTLDAYVQTLRPNLAADAEEIRKIRERELERKRQEAAELEKKYEDVKAKNVRQDTDARQTALKKKKKDELEMGMG
nr:hypothetical protein [uncultured Campylobacter sp.]